MKYSSKIISIGAGALDYLEDDENSFIIIFDNNAPDNLKEIAIIHSMTELISDPAKGDTLAICGKAFDITAVGGEALTTLKHLGHCTISFKGGDEPERPGMIMVQGPKLKKEDIFVGGNIEIY